MLPPIKYPKRLLKLAALLEKDAKNKRGIKFDLYDWAETNNDKLTLDCGTAACAMGFAVLSGKFRKQGLRNWYKGRDSGHDLAPVCNGRIGFAAAEELFGISGRAAEYLFSAQEYPVRKRKGAVAELYVANRIRKFVESGGEYTPTAE